VISAGEHGKAVIRNSQSGQTIGTLDGHTDLGVKAQFSPDGQWIVSYAGTRALIWSVSNLDQPLYTVNDHSELIHAIDFSNEGDKVLTLSEDSTAVLSPIATADEWYRHLSMAKQNCEQTAASG